MKRLRAMTQWYWSFRSALKTSSSDQQWVVATEGVSVWRGGGSGRGSDGVECSFFLMCCTVIWPRAMAPVAAKLLKTEPCPYMVITECSATSFCLALVGMWGTSSTQRPASWTAAELTGSESSEWTAGGGGEGGGCETRVFNGSFPPS